MEDLDQVGLKCLASKNIEWGADGVAVSVVAGEFYKFSDEERKKCYELVVDKVDGKVPVWAGVSHMGTEPSVELAKFAKEVGADGIIAMPPLVGRESSMAFEEHFTTIMRKVDLPLMIQDAEGFAPIFMSPTLYLRLSDEYSNLVSVKIEGGNTLAKIRDVKKLVGGRLTILGGMAAVQMFEEMELGSEGNVPDACLTDMLVNVYKNYKNRNVTAARSIFAKYLRWANFMMLHQRSASEIEKETLRLRGVVGSSHTRSPHVPLKDEEKFELRTLLNQIGTTQG